MQYKISIIQPIQEKFIIRLFDFMNGFVIVFDDDD